MKREPTKSPSVTRELLVPIGDVKKPEEPTCFGKMWDVADNSCIQCADRDICGIIYQRELDAHAKEIEKKLGSKFLDQTCFKPITEELVRAELSSGCKISELVELCVDKSSCDDMPSVTRFLKEFIKGNDFISTQDGRVWIK